MIVRVALAIFMIAAGVQPAIAQTANVYGGVGLEAQGHRDRSSTPYWGVPGGATLGWHAGVSWLADRGRTVSVSGELSRTGVMSDAQHARGGDVVDRRETSVFGFVRFHLRQQGLMRLEPVLGFGFGTSTQTFDGHAARALRSPAVGGGFDVVVGTRRWAVVPHLRGYYYMRGGYRGLFPDGFSPLALRAGVNLRATF